MIYDVLCISDVFFFFFSSRRRHTRFDCDWSSDVCSSDLAGGFREDREGKRIPLGKNLAVGDVFAVLKAETRAVNDVVTLLLAVLFVNDGDRPARFMAMSVPPRPSTRLRSTNLTMPLLRASRVERSETRVAVPPMWNVRMVSCVPGSPMDCAAMTPTASPSSTMRPVARLRP